MPMTKRDIFALTAGAILLVGITAGASAYYLNSDDAVEERSQAVSQIQPAAATTRTTTQAAPAPLPECDDDNIVGKVVGGVGVVYSARKLVAVPVKQQRPLVGRLAGQSLARNMCQPKMLPAAKTDRNQ